MLMPLLLYIFLVKYTGDLILFQYFILKKNSYSNRFIFNNFHNNHLPIFTINKLTLYLCPYSKI